MPFSGGDLFSRRLLGCPKSPVMIKRRVEKADLRNAAEDELGSAAVNLVNLNKIRRAGEGLVERWRGRMLENQSALIFPCLSTQKAYL